MTDTDEAGETLAGYVQDLLMLERDQRDSLERRAATVLSSSALLVTVLLGLLTLATRNPPVHLSRLCVGFVVAGAALFAVAVLGAIVTAMPQLSGVAVAADVLNWIKTHWSQPSDRAAKKVVATRLAQYSDLLRVNRRKALALGAATVAESAAVISLAASIIVLLVGG
jgi:hypothetical protein